MDITIGLITLGFACAVLVLSGRYNKVPFTKESKKSNSGAPRLRTDSWIGKGYRSLSQLLGFL